jgi:lipid-A-disaccharide synthase
MPKRIMIITGEVSGDLYGSLLATEIFKIEPGVEMSGVGAERMVEAGVETFLDSKDLSVVGFWEAITRIHKLRQALDYVKRQIAKRVPDLLILIDYPGMNLRLARFAKTRGVKVMYYVSPQIWAWGRDRIKLIRKNVDKMAVILPFEVEMYEREGIDVSYVGHPLIDIVGTDLGREEFVRRLCLPADGKLVALLPGSRTQEIRQHIEPLMRMASKLRQKVPGVEFLIVTLPALRDLVVEHMERSGESLAITTDHRYDAISHSDLAVACSGTATLEAALLGTPMIVIYRLALLSWAVGRLIVKVPYISLANLVAGEEIVPEFIQNAVNADALAAEAADILTNDKRRTRMESHLQNVKLSLGPGGATARAAQLALSLIGE